MKVLDRIYEAIARESPGCIADDVKQHAGGVNMVEPNLDALVDAVRRSTTRVQPRGAQVMKSVCSACPYQFASGYCALREMKQCVLHVHATAVMGAIAIALRELELQKSY